MKLRINLQKIITPSIFLTMFTFVVSISAWLFFYYVNPVSHSMKGNLGVFAETIIPSQSFLAHVITLVLAIIMALLITQINNKYSFINTRSFLHTFLFLLLSTSLVTTHGNYLTYLAALLVMYSIYLFFDNYGKENGTEIAFLGFIFLGLSVFVVPEFILLIPLFWIGFYQIRALSFRTFFASIFGFLAPWLAIYVYIYFSTNQLYFYPEFLSVFNNLSIIHFKNTQSIIYGVFILVIILILLTNVASRTNREAIKTRKMLFFFQTIGFGLLLLIVFASPNFRAYIPLGLSIFSIFASYTFTFQRSFFYSILFILLCLVSVSFAIVLLIQ